jgi:phosphoenolpyruvate carboxykinase (GTP)
MGTKLKKPPQIFHVNWFRRDASGHFLWPGFGENLRVLAWMLERAAGSAGAADSPIGFLPRPEDLNTTGLSIKPEALHDLLNVDPTLWRKEVADMRQYFAQYGERLPRALLDQLSEVEARLGA